MAELTVNGVDLAILGVTMQNPGRWRSAPPHIFERVQVIDRPGAIVRSTHEDAQLFEWPILIDGADAATLDTYMEKLNALFTRNGEAGLPNTIISGDRPGFYLLGHHIDFETTPRGAGFITTGFAGRWRVLVSDPPAYISSTLTTVSSITTTPVELPQRGGRPIDVVLAIFEPTDPVITLRDHNDATVGDPMEFTFTPVTNEYLVINITKRTIYRNLTGDPDEGTENSCDWTGGDFLELRTSDWDFVSGGNPDLAISSGDGTLKYRQTRK
jgi:hypothetical protein